MVSRLPRWARLVSNQRPLACEASAGVDQAKQFCLDIGRQLRDRVATGRSPRRPPDQRVTARSALLGEVLDDLIDLLDSATAPDPSPGGPAGHPERLPRRSPERGAANDGSEELSESRRSSRISPSSRSTPPSSRSTWFASASNTTTTT